VAERSELGRVRASFGVFVGLFALAAGVGLRLFPQNDEIPRLSPEIGWLALALSLAAVLSAFISRPKRDFLLDLGLLPLVGLCGLLMPIFGLMEDVVRDQLVPAGLECAGGFALIVSAIRFLRAHAASSLLPKLELPKKSKKVKLRREGVKKMPEVPIASLVKGDLIELGTGEDIPVDGRVASGSGFVDESALIGPSLPTAKKPGDPLFAGTHSSIPELLLEVGAPRDDAFLVRHREHTEGVARELIATTRAGRIWGAVVIALSLAGIGLVLATHDLSRLESWLPPVLAIVLGAVAAAPSLSLMYGRASVLASSAANGLSFVRAKDVTALARVRRWQIDPTLLAAPGEVEAVALADTPPDALLQIASALLDAEKGPELHSVRAALQRKKLPAVQGAALSKTKGVHRGTVDGKRYLLGPQQALAEEENVAIDDTMIGPVDFLRDKKLITHLLATAEEGVIGAIGIGLTAEADAKLAAKQLGATVMPGLPDSARKALADSAGIECDGPPLDKRSATLLFVDSAPPSDGLRLRVMPLAIGAPLPDGSSPRLFRPALANAANAAATAKRIYRTAQLRAVILAFVPVSLATGLAYAGVAGGAIGTLIGVLAVILSGRGPRLESRQSTAALQSAPAPVT
jgi:hypothetical protein